MDDDGDAGDDIFAADIRSRSKRKNDDYVEVESEEEFLPKPKRFASRGKIADDDGDSDSKMTTKTAKGSSKPSTTARKRKRPSLTLTMRMKRKNHPLARSLLLKSLGPQGLRKLKSRKMPIFKLFLTTFLQSDHQLRHRRIPTKNLTGGRQPRGEVTLALHQIQ